MDDNVDAASILTMLSEAFGHEVLVKHGASRALDRAKEAAPHVCLLDIGLPGMDGNELAKRLRDHPLTAKSVLIAVTGYGQESDRKHTMAAGFDHHLVKPVDMRKLAFILAESRKYNLLLYRLTGINRSLWVLDEGTRSLKYPPYLREC